MKGKLRSPWSFAESSKEGNVIVIYYLFFLFYLPNSILLSSSLLENELHSFGSYVLTLTIFVLCLLVVTLSNGMISVVLGRASVF